jgi:hypothetical protein
MSDSVLIERINIIIKEAIEHGGDSGGAYFSNSEVLIKEMKYFLRWTGFDKDYGIMNEDGWIRFYKKSHIVE